MKPYRMVSARLLQILVTLANRFLLKPKCLAAAWNSSMKNVFDCYAGTKKDLETDLKLLNLSYVDLVIVHFPPISSMITRSCNNWSGGCQMVRAQWKAMTEFYTEGKARAIGVSNYCPSCYQCLEAMDNLTMPMVNQARNRKKPIDKG